jgi:hypothetical protein
MKHCLKQRIKRKESILVKVSDEWYGNFPGGFVEARLSLKGDRIKRNFDSITINENRISFWGDDDFGMEKSYPDKESARLEFESLINKVLNKDLLKKLGFLAC